jgi:hypothetical protein
MRRRSLATGAWLTAITALVVAVEWGKRVEQREPWVKLREVDGWDWRFSWRTAVAIGTGLVVWWLLPRMAATMRLRLLLPLTGLCAGVFALLLALSDGEEGVLEPVRNPTEYWEYQPKLPPLREFLDVYVDKVKWWPVHMRGHPPLFTMVLKLLRWLGLDGPWPVAGLSIAATMAVPMLVLVTVHRLVGPAAVRKLAPFLVLTPYAVWAMTSADIVYSAIGAAVVATVVLAVQSSNRLRRLGWSSLAGVAFAVLMFSTYGAVMFSIVVLAAALGAAPDVSGQLAGGLSVGCLAQSAARAAHATQDHRSPSEANILGPACAESALRPRKQGRHTEAGPRMFTALGPSSVKSLSIAAATILKRSMSRLRSSRLVEVAVVAAVPIVVVTLTFRHFGFWWLDGAKETKRLYWKGTAQFRTWTYFTLVDATVPLIALGPAFVHAITRLRGRLWWLVGGALLAIIASTASQISKGEIERIWLIFYPWMLVAAVALPKRQVRWWLGAQLVLTVILQMGLLSKW